MTLVSYSSWFPAGVDELFAFHADVGNLPRISPPFPRLAVHSSGGSAKAGDLQEIAIVAGPLRLRWEARLTRVSEGRLVEDVQERGPFLRWRHQHRMAAEGSGSRLTDVVAFRLLPTVAGEFVEYFSVRPLLWLMFAFRHRATKRLLGAGGSPASH